jgi:tRNA threonylcarbamoyl adenosine modification protein YeaZ
MITFGLDTSSDNILMCLVKDGLLTAATSVQSNHDQISRLTSIVDDFLSSNSVSLNDINCYAIGMGPGSFSAIRIGVSFVFGLNLFRQNKIITVNTLEILSHNHDIHSTFIFHYGGNLCYKLHQGSYESISVDDVKNLDGNIVTNSKIIADISKNAQIQEISLAMFAGIIIKKMTNNEYHSGIIKPMYIKEPDAKISNKCII